MRLMASISGAFALVLLGSSVSAESQALHRVVEPESIKWGPGPTSLRPGAQSALLYGDPTKPGLFVMRLNLPKGFRVAPHLHPRPEILTIISGRVRLGMGRVADRAKARPLSTGSFSAMGPNMPHFSFAEEDSVLQISTIGPWSVRYINPADDPRIKRK